MSQAQKPWHAMEVEEVATYWDSNAEAGLPSTDIPRRRAELGENAIPAPPKPSAVKQFLSGFSDPLVIALLAAAAIAAGVAATGHETTSWIQRYSDTMAILLIVIVNGVLGFLQERRAEAALDALQKMAAPNAKVVRDGVMTIVPARELIPGDLIELEPGDAVPADVRIATGRDFATEEAALTGEAAAIEKSTDTVKDTNAVLADRTSIAYMGTTIVRGRARAIVVQTGPFTELGRIGTMIRDAEREDTPLELRLAQFGKQILIACLAISALLFAIGILRGQQHWTVLLLTAVSLAVAAIPEGLPAITTITLALGMQRMAQRGAIVRKLPAVETLGSATIVCSDKTGTLTQNAMTVRHLETAEERLDVSGEGYLPRGEFTRDGVKVEELSAPMKSLLATATLCNTAIVDVDGNDAKIIGDPTEAALVTVALKANIHRAALLMATEIVHEMPFDSDRKRMSIITRNEEGVRKAHVKGSPDVLLPLCTHVMTSKGPVPLVKEERARLIARNEELAGQALRVLALAERSNPDVNNPEASLVFLGFAAMIDPPRPEVKLAVEECKRAGVRVVMITGDHKLTAIAIAKELGFWHEHSTAFTGTELEEYDDQRLMSIVENAAVFARVTAEQKLRIVRALKRRGHVVGMTGDGVNDAPALREAQIGISMGKGGTDVAREASDMVLADDNFATIVHAIREGRAIFRNIKKFIFFLNSSNAGLVVPVVIGSFFTDTQNYALTPLQLLWINLVTNGLPALALGVDPPEPGQMEEPPRSVTERLLGWRESAGTVFVGIIMGGAALALYLLPDHAPHWLGPGDRNEHFAQVRTMAFTLLAISPLFHAFNCRSARSSIVRVGLFSNRYLWGAVLLSASIHLITIFVPPLRPIFKTNLMSGTEWLIVLGLSFLPVPIFEVMKRVLPKPKAEPLRNVPG
ncbi:MAG: cation-transporting P-type ATPase [Sandaracinaceae bacterium]|nr:cation-transporting P-type ATPase [Sandaracinaceae bacterium]